MAKWKSGSLWNNRIHALHIRPMSSFRVKSRFYESCWSPYIELHRAIWHDIAEQMRETDVGKCKFAPPFMTEWVLF